MLLEEIIYRHCPTGNGRLGFRNLAPTIACRMIRVGSSIDSNCVIVQESNIPHYLCPRHKIVSNLPGNPSLRLGAIIIFTTHFRRKYWRTLKEFHPARFPSVKGGIRAKRFPMRQINLKQAQIKVL